MATFSVLVLTAPPVGQSAESAGHSVKVDGRECLLRSVELFLNRDEVKQVQVVFNTDFAEEGKRKFGGHLGLFGVKVITSAGSKWIDQIASAAERISEECTHVVIHDAARPLVPFSDIDALFAEIGKREALALTAPLKASLIETDEGGGAAAFHSPSRFVQLLTPIVYTKAKFLEMAKGKKELHASLYTLLPGSPLNVRVGTAADAGLAKALLGLMPKPKVKALNNPFEEAQW